MWFIVLNDKYTIVRTKATFFIYCKHWQYTCVKSMKQEWNLEHKAIVMSFKCMLNTLHTLLTCCIQSLFSMWDLIKSPTLDTLHNLRAYDKQKHSQILSKEVNLLISCEVVSVHRLVVVNQRRGLFIRSVIRMKTSSA